MRIVRIVVALLIMLAVMIPFVTLASESPSTETKTNISLNAISNFFFPNVVKADEQVEVIEPIVAPIAEEVPVKTAEEIKNEAILEKWKIKQTEKWNNLPKGQFTINASAYTASADECDNNKGITSSGIKVHAGTIACPPEFPFGAKMNIEGYGTFTCEDRGGAIKGNHVDIYMVTKAEAFKFGRRNLIAEMVL